MSQANADQIEYWNGEVGERWVEMQTRMDACMSDIAAAVLALAGAKPGERVLDVGCGCGATTLALAKAVGLSGHVTAIDVSRPMLDLAQRRAEEAGADIAFVEADASEQEFTAPFDLVFSRFGVMFFADPVAAFANLRHALKPKGRLRFVCWRAPAQNLWATAPFAAVKDLLPPQEEADPDAPGPFAFADDARLKAILGDAGFSGVRIEKLDTVMLLGADVPAALEQSLKIGPCARAIAGADEALKDQVRARIADVLVKFKTERGIAARRRLLAGERGELDVQRRADAG